MGSEGYGNPFTTFGMGPGGQGARYGDLSDPGKQFYEQNPGAGYMNYLQTQGLGGGDKRSMYAQSQQGRYYNQFLANLGRNNLIPGSADNQDTYWSGYLQDKVNANQDFNNLGPADRGDANMQAPRLRWLMSVI